jgi:hypothetical protein
MQTLKQNFDNATLEVSNQESGYIRLDVMLELDTKDVCRSTIWLDNDQRLELIKILQDMATGDCDND